VLSVPRLLLPSSDSRIVIAGRRQLLEAGSSAALVSVWKQAYSSLLAKSMMRTQTVVPSPFS
jgi:hypothetical protein